MGYYANAAIDNDLYDTDRSYFPHEQQLLRRLEQLESRLEELTADRVKYEDHTRFSKTELRYVLPEHFKSVSALRDAIALAVSELEERYGIVTRQKAPEIPAMDELTEMQLSFAELCLAA
jgi:predicted nuclease with TOPRIM domain